MQGCSAHLYARLCGVPDTTPKSMLKGRHYRSPLLVHCRDFPQKLVPGRRAQPAKMGLAFTKLFARLFSKKEMRILMVRRTLRPLPFLSDAAAPPAGPRCA